jgi:hypothetical protein
VDIRLTGRAIAGAATVLALAGGGVAYAASGDETGTTQHRAQTSPQQDGARRAGPDRVFGLGGPGAPGDRFRGRHAGPGPGPAFGFGLGGPGGPALGGKELGGAAATYLGLSERALREQLADGRSLADVARAQGKTVEGLQDAIVAAATTAADRAVDDGWLGPRARDAILARLREHVGDLVAATPPPLPPGGGRPGERGFHLRHPGADCRPAPQRRS